MNVLYNQNPEKPGIQPPKEDPTLPDPHIPEIKPPQPKEPPTQPNPHIPEREPHRKQEPPMVPPHEPERKV